MGPFDRFNDRAKRVLALAQDEAIRFNHNYIGTEHLLLGLIREGEGVAARVLASMGVELMRCRTSLEFIVGRGDSTTSPTEITLSPRTKKVIELALDEARRLGHSHVGTEHLLLGLVREGEGIASGILQSQQIDLETIRHHTIQALGQQDPLMPTPSGPQPGPWSQPDPRVDAQGNKRDWYCEDVLTGKLKVFVIHQDQHVIAFEHPYPEYVAHAVVIPKKHIASLMDDSAADPELLAAMLRAVQYVARSVGLHQQGFRVETNAGAPGVTPHMHWHVIGPGLPPPRRGQSHPPQPRSSQPRPPQPRPPGAPSAGPFGALSDRAKRVFALAQNEATMLQHGHIGTEHLLPAFLRDSDGDSPAAKALTEAGVTLSGVRAGAERAVPRGDTKPSQQVLTPRMKRLFELAEVLAGQGMPVGRGHILMALIDEGGGVAVGLLRELGVDLSKLRARTLELMKQQ